MTPAGIAGVYGVAVTASIGVGLGIRKVLSPFEPHFKSKKGLFLNFLISFCAVGSANFVNLLLMRSKEMKEGIMLQDQQGNEVGKSKTIGRTAVLQTGLTRYVMPIGPLLIPTLTFYLMEKRKLIPKNRFLKMSVETLVFLAALTFAPPMATAIFPQTAVAQVSKLENEF
jgi:hypothetical protein